MTIRHPLTPDGLAIVALTTRRAAAGPTPDEDRDGAKPLTPREWSRVAAALTSAGETPSMLLGRAVADLDGLLGATTISTDLIARLGDRATTLAMDIERLESRGIWLVTIDDAAYPRRLRARLGDSAPPVIFGAGAVDLLDAGGVAIIGSRDADPASLAFASEAAASVARSGRPVISGGAKGVDAAAMNGAVEAGGAVVGVLADSLERRARSVALRNLVQDERVVLLSPNGSDVPFSVGLAMGRNRLIYCLADLAVVVSASEGEGGTWAGATEALKARWVPIYTRITGGLPAGNAALVSRGALPLDGQPAAVADLSTETSGYIEPPAGARSHGVLVAEQQALFDLEPIPEPTATKKRRASRKARESQATS